MRVAYVTTMKRGLPAFVYRELAQLSHEGVGVAVYTTKYAPGLYMPQPDWPLEHLRPAIVLLRQPWHFLCSPRRYTKLLFTALRTRSLLDFLIGIDYAVKMQRCGVSMIHCAEGLHSLAIGYYCHLLTGLPLLVTIYADAIYMASDWLIIHEALRACQSVITICEFNCRKIVDTFGLPPERVQLVRLSVNLEAFQPSTAVTVLIVGQWSQRKGHETLLKALQTLNRDDIRVWVVGHGTWGSVGDYVDVPQLARDLGVADRVTFFGSVSEEVLRVLYQKCDIFCLPSRKYVVNEGLPVSLMEAMSCAKPVISTHHAGIPELVPDILIEENDDVELARAISFLADHPDLREEMGRRNRAIVERDYSPSNIAQRVTLFTAAAKEISKGR